MNDDKTKIFTTEKDVEDLALKFHIQKFKQSQEKEKYIKELPYSDEYARIHTNNVGTCTSVMIRTFYLSLVVAVGFKYLNAILFYSI